LKIRLKNAVVLLFMQQPKNVLKNVFGYDNFRENQLEIIEHALSEQDAMAIMPTGGGKSICFQIPAILKPNVTLVISPLISLMKDQVESLRANGVEVAYYNSTMPDSAKTIVRNRALQNDLKLLYLSPETLIGGIEWIKHVPVSMIAVDEAHCVSMWGHDFRPEYQQIGSLRKYFPNIPFHAYTATADKITRKDISAKLELRSPSVFISSFDRPNLSLEVRAQIPKSQRKTEYVDFIKSHKDESGIIYCLSRKETESWSNYLNDCGISSRFYHAGMNAQERDLVQEGFINDSYHVICATIAFGMGIDKSNVRWVIHNNLPKNIEGYYQEIGRAGRDGLPSDTLLYYNYRDVVLLNDFVKDSELKEVYQEKVNRMLKYAEATTCRRKILLAYFGEHILQDCGNCDVCASPPEFFDGSVIALKALSALLRSKESVGANLLINLLRGSKSIEIFERKLNLIKTYGAGSEYSFKQWQHFVNQLINQGVLEIAYDEKMWLKVTELGHEILRNNETIKLTAYSEKDLKSKSSAKKSSTIDIGKSNSNLIAALKSWRKSKASKNSVPAYVILHDTTLHELAQKLPTQSSELLGIQGLGKVKIDRFGAELIEIIMGFSNSKQNTYEQTFELYKSGISIQEISQNRNLKEHTIINHLIKLFEEGKTVDLFQFITEFELQQVKSIRKNLNNTFQLKPIHDELKGEVSYPKISVAIAILTRQT
jgi:ATP-dependent DNA helicase RecQ